ncbi:MAG: Transposase IS4 family protein, partial [Candidatus Uhrbacteria bacterium GW2011_GWF2_39_13]
AYQSGLFQAPIRSTNKEYRDLCERLEIVDRILTESGLEFEFASDYVEQIRQAGIEHSGNPNFEMNPKAVERYTLNAVRALRCNYLRIDLHKSFREAAFLFAASEDFRRFIFGGDFANNKSPGKSKLQEFASIVPEEIIRKLNASLATAFSAEGNVFHVFELEEPLDVKDIWIDSTCLMAMIHFPVDWVLLRDAVRTLVKAILCIRRHGLKHRIPAPESFLNQINSYCMEMANCRRRKDSDKCRKNVLRRMKKLCRTVKKHAQNYRDILFGNRRKTDLSDKQIDRIVERIDNVLEKLPVAIEQAHRRIIRGEKLDADEKILSLYDDNAAAIVRGKSGAEVEFGNELFIAEQRNGFIADWQLYEDKTADQKKFREFMARYNPQNHGVQSITSDRGFAGKPNNKELEKHNIYNGLRPRSPADLEAKNNEEKFKPLQKRRSQTEGRIAAVKRFIGQHMPCRKFDDKKSHTAWSVLTHNLHLLAKMISAARRQKEKAAA